MRTELMRRVRKELYIKKLGKIYLRLTSINDNYLKIDSDITMVKNILRRELLKP